MPTTITLDSIRKAAEAKYGSTDIQIGDKTVRLLNPLRLPKEKRTKLIATQRQLDTTAEDAADVDQEALLADSVRLVAATPAQAKLLLDAVGGDLAVLAEVFAEYSRGTQVGGSLSLAELVDDYGDGLYPDLLHHFGVDLVEVIAGRGPAPALVVALVLGLPDTSLTAALAAGGRRHFGWGVDRHLTADLYDAITLQTRVTGQWRKGKPPELPPWPRPHRTTASSGTTGAGARVRVADLYQRFARR